MSNWWASWSRKKNEWHTTEPWLNQLGDNYWAKAEPVGQQLLSQNWASWTTSIEPKLSQLDHKYMWKANNNWTGPHWAICTSTNFINNINICNTEHETEIGNSRFYIPFQTKSTQLNTHQILYFQLGIVLNFFSLCLQLGSCNSRQMLFTVLFVSNGFLLFWFPDIFEPSLFINWSLKI